MQLGIFAKTFPGDIEANMAAVAASGISVVQYNLSIAGLQTVPDAVPENIIARIARAATEHHVALSAISGTFNIAHPDPAIRATGIERFPVLARTAVALGIPLVTLSSGTRHPDDMWKVHPDNDTPEAWRDSFHSLSQLSQIAESYGLTIAFEPEHTNIVATADLGRAMLDAVGSASLKVVFDAANLIDTRDLERSSMRRIIRDAIDKLSGDIALAHAKELVPDRSPTAPGNGVLPWKDIVEGLLQANYDGAIIVHGLPVDNVPKAVETLTPLLQEDE